MEDAAQYEGDVWKVSGNATHTHTHTHAHARAWTRTHTRTQASTPEPICTHARTQASTHTHMALLQVLCLLNECDRHGPGKILTSSFSADVTISLDTDRVYFCVSEWPAIFRRNIRETSKPLQVQSEWGSKMCWHNRAELQKDSLSNIFFFY